MKDIMNILHLVVKIYLTLGDRKAIDTRPIFSQMAYLEKGPYIVRQKGPSVMRLLNDHYNHKCSTSRYSAYREFTLQSAARLFITLLM